VTTPIRPAELHEARDLADLWLRSRLASFPSIPPTVHSDDEVRRWFEGVVLPLREVWVAEQGLRPMALMILDGAHVDQLYVDPSCTGHGLGGALLHHAKVRRPTGLTLWTFQSNLGARRFYERHGFVAVATTDDNEERVPAVRYEWRPAP
jgi:GNAT superfamily N-acetyltransferase